MPWSHPLLKVEVAQFVAPLNLGGTIIEIGPGAGQIGQVLRHFAPQARLQAIEVYAPYVHQYELTNLYNLVFVRDVREVADWFWSGSHPAVSLSVWVEGPEHLTKKAALHQVQRIARLSEHGLLFSTPLGDYPQGGWTDAEGGVNEAESHLSTWEKADWEKIGAVCIWEDLSAPSCAMFHLRGSL